MEYEAVVSRHVKLEPGEVYDERMQFNDNTVVSIHVEAIGFQDKTVAEITGASLAADLKLPTRGHDPVIGIMARDGTELPKITRDGKTYSFVMRERLSSGAFDLYALD